MLTLHYADYIVFAGLLVISAMVGPYYWWRDKNKPSTSESYFVGNRSLHLIPTAASLFASFWSAIALVGIPLELYTGGARFAMASLGQATGIILGAVVAVPVVYNLKMISAYEYFELRFKSKLLRKIGTVLNVLAYVFYLAVVTYAPCIALEAVSPIPLWAGVVLTACVTTFYTVLGGIKAVVLVDLFQAIVMFGGVFVIIILGYSKIDGGFPKAMEIAYKGGRLNFFDFNPDPTNTYGFWAMVIPPILADAGLYTTSQAAVQRFSALSSVQKAKWAVMSIAPQILLLNALLFFFALAMFAYYDSQGCDPLRGGIITNPNQLTTFYIADVLSYPGLAGVWFAGLFSGSLSSMSTGYNSMAACIWEDLLKDHLHRCLGPRGTSIVLKVISLMLGVVTCLLALCFKYLSGSVLKLSSSTVGVFGAAIYIAYFSGAIIPFANTIGTIFGMVAGMLLILFIAGGQMFFKLANEQSWLPTNTANCTQMIARLLASGKYIPSEMTTNLPSVGSTTKAVTTSLLLLSSSSGLLPALSSSGPQSFSLMVTNSSNIDDAFVTPAADFTLMNWSPKLVRNNERFLLTKSPSMSGDGAITNDDFTASSTQEPSFFTTTTAHVTIDENAVNNNSNETTTSTKSKSINLPGPLVYIFSFSYFLFPFLSLLFGATVTVLVSLCTGGLRTAKDIDPKYMMVPNCFWKGGPIQERTAESWYLQDKSSEDKTKQRRFFEDAKDYAAARGISTIIPTSDDEITDTWAASNNDSKQQPVEPAVQYTLTVANRTAVDEDEYDDQAVYQNLPSVVPNPAYSSLSKYQVRKEEKQPLV